MSEMVGSRDIYASKTFEEKGLSILSKHRQPSKINTFKKGLEEQMMADIPGLTKDSVKEILSYVALRWDLFIFGVFEERPDFIASSLTNNLYQRELPLTLAL